MKTSLPDGWKAVPLGELGRWTGGGTPSKANPSFWTTKGIPWVSPKDMKRLLIDDAADHITKAGVEGSATNVVPTGSILVVTRSGILSHTLPVAKTLRPVAINQDMKALVAVKEYVPDFLLYALRAHEERILQECGKSGTTVANIDTDRLLEFRVPIPPYDEQGRIIAKLDALLERSKSVREELAHIPRLVERYRRAILAAAFDGELTAEWRKHKTLPDPAPSALDGIVAKPIRNGLSVRGSDNPPGVRSLRLSALRSGIVDLTDVRFLQIPSERAAKYLLEEGDVLISRGNGTKSFVGLAALVPLVEKKTIFPDTAFRIRLDKKIARPAWFTLIWNSPQVRAQIESSAKTTAGIWKVSQGDIGRVELKLPHPDEQDEILRRIESLLSNLESTAQEVSRASSLLDRLEQATLAKAFRGDLVSPDSQRATKQRKVVNR